MSSLNCLSVNIGAARLILLAKVFFEVSIVYATSRGMEGGGGRGGLLAVTASEGCGVIGGRE